MTTSAPSKPTAPAQRVALSKAELLNLATDPALGIFRSALAVHLIEVTDGFCKPASVFFEGDDRFNMGGLLGALGHADTYRSLNYDLLSRELLDLLAYVVGSSDYSGGWISVMRPYPCRHGEIRQHGARGAVIRIF